MTLTFTLQKWLHGDPYLATFSTPLPDLADKAVAIVGNARSLQTTEHGPKIDACDTVIRMHKAPLPSPTSHGTRTSWIALANSVPMDTLTQRAPERLLWMAKKRKRLRHAYARWQGFYLHPKSDWDRMAKTLGANPTTGVMLIDLIARTHAKEIHLFGFDFFASLSLSGRRTADKTPHNFAAEKSFTYALIQQDPRITLHAA